VVTRSERFRDPQFSSASTIRLLTAGNLPLVQINREITIFLLIFCS
jgi:hypothetical protein